MVAFHLPPYHSHNILAAEDILRSAAGSHFPFHLHSYLDSHCYNPARTRCCNHHIRIHPADTGRIVEGGIAVQALEAENSPGAVLVSALPSHPLSRYRAVVALDTDSDRRPS